MKIVVAGSHGQLGNELISVLREGRDVVGMDLPDLDIGDRSSVRRALDRHCPDLLVNCAAFTNVDACETRRAEAERVNGRGPALLAEEAQRDGVRLIHVSTDYVFDGTRPPPEPYGEDDPVNPLSWYGKTKRMGEEGVLAANPAFVILRTAWLYGVHGRNFAKTILRMVIREPEREWKIVNNQFGTPTWAYRLAKQIAALADEARATGVVHATAEGWTTWYEYAAFFLRCMDVPHRLVPCSSADYPTPARRPANSILENGVLQRLGCRVMVDWKQDVAEYVRCFRAVLMEEARR